MELHKPTEIKLWLKFEICLTNDIQKNFFISVSNEILLKCWKVIYSEKATLLSLKTLLVSKGDICSLF